MIHYPADGLGKVVVELIDPILFRVLRRFAHKISPAGDQFPEGLADGGVIGDRLGNNIAGIHILPPVCGVNIITSQHRRVLTVLGKNGICQRPQASFPGDGGPGTALLLIGKVQVLYLRQGCGVINGGRQLLRQLSLIFNGPLDLLPALLQAPQIV